jgi:antitoxin component YwqK of YwqJK toxin-antitoxin module
MKNNSYDLIGDIHGQAPTIHMQRDRIEEWLLNIRIRKIHAEYYPSGKKKSKGYLIFGNKDGKWNEWHENGQRKSQGYYSQDIVYGKWTYWYDNAQKRSEGNYLWVDHGKGTWVTKYKDWTYWHEDGTFDYKK